MINLRKSKKLQLISNKRMYNYRNSQIDIKDKFLLKFENM